MRGTVRPVGEYVPVTMEPPVVPDGSVSAAGADDRAVSLGDVQRARRASVLAYCARICDPTRIGEAADAAFAELHAALEAAPSYRPVDLDRMLLEATRHAAAERVDATAPTSGGRLGSRRSTRTCELMPTLLAARESGRLSASDRAALERHLTKCASCRDLAQRRAEAEQAYTALIGAAVEPSDPQEPFAPGDPEPEVFASRSEAKSAGAMAFAAAEPEAFGQEADRAPEPDDFEPEGLEDEAEPQAAAEPEAEPFAEPEDEGFDDEPEPEAFSEPGAATEPEPEAFSEPEVATEPEPEPEDDTSMRLADPPEFELPAPPVHTEEFDAFADEPDDPRDTMPGWRDGAPIGGKRTRTRRGPGRGVIIGLFVAGLVILAIGLAQLFSGGDDGGDSGQKPAARQAAATPAPAPAQQPTRAELRRRARLRSLGDRELGPGTSGDDVKALQKLLGVSQTGNFGELTTFALTDFQSKHGLKATGIADEATKRKLARRTKPPRQAPTPPQTQQTQPDQGTTGTTPQGGTGTAPQGTTGTQPQGGTGTQGTVPQTGQPSAGQ